MDKWLSRILKIVFIGVVLWMGYSVSHVASAATDSQLGQGLSAMVEGLTEFFKAVVDLILGL